MKFAFLVTFGGVQAPLYAPLMNEFSNKIAKSAHPNTMVRPRPVSHARIMNVVLSSASTTTSDEAIIKACHLDPTSTVGGVIEECHLDGSCAHERRLPSGACPLGTTFMTFMNLALSNNPYDFEKKFMIIDEELNLQQVA